MFLLYRTLGIGAIIGSIVLLFISYGNLLVESIGLLMIGILFTTISGLILSVRNLDSMLVHTRYTDEFLEHLVNNANKYRIKGDWFLARDTLYSLPKLNGAYFIPIDVLSDFNVVEGTSITFSFPNEEKYTFSIRSINRSQNTEIIEVYKELFVKASSLGLTVDLGRGVATITLSKENVSR